MYRCSQIGSSAAHDARDLDAKPAKTQRHKLGRLLGGKTRNLLLVSATPHNGKEADLQLFMGLLDADRFER